MSKAPIVHFEAASTLAVVVSSNEPLLFLAEDLTIIAASASFCRAFEIDPASVPGAMLWDRCGTGGLPTRPGPSFRRAAPLPGLSLPRPLQPAPKQSPLLDRLEHRFRPLRIEDLVVGEPFFQV